MLDVDMPARIEGQRLHAQPSHGMTTQTLGAGRLVHRVQTVEPHSTRGYLIVWCCGRHTFEAHLADEQTFDGVPQCVDCTNA